MGWGMGGMIATTCAALHGKYYNKVIVLSGTAGSLHSRHITPTANRILMSDPEPTELEKLWLLFPLEHTSGEMRGGVGRAWPLLAGAGGRGWGARSPQSRPPHARQHPRTIQCMPNFDMQSKHEACHRHQTPSLSQCPLPSMCSCGGCLCVL